MNRIDSLFDNLKKQNKKALIPFITVGDYSVDDTYNLVLELEKSGADLIELGIPFSDPVAEGPVIQKSSFMALNNKINLDIVFDLVKKIRKVSKIPLVFMMYINTAFNYGYERFSDMLNETGVDGVIIPDIPYEEKDEITKYLDLNNKYFITLVAPTSIDRIKLITKNSKGFIYLVSSFGVTGIRDSFDTDLERFVSSIKENTNTPVCVGFGISNKEQAKLVAKYSDGVIIGSAIIKLIQDNNGDIKKAVRFVKEIREELNN